MADRRPAISFPTPTEAVGWRRIWWWSLPGRTLTGLSILTGVAVFALLLASEEGRGLFFLPGPAWLFGLLAGVMAAVVAAVGRHRPGRIGPRLWAPLLALAALGSTVSVLWPGQRFDPVANAAVAASAAAALVLAFRLARPVLSGRRVEWMLAGAFATAALLVVGFVPIGSQAARQSWQSEISQATTALGKASAATARAGHSGDSEAEVARVRAALDELAAIRLEPLYDARLWRAAAVLGRRDALLEAWRGATEAIARGLDAEHAPSLASYRGPAVWWSRTDQAWLADPSFTDRTVRMGRQVQELGRLLAELDPRRVGSGSFPAELQARHDAVTEASNRRSTELATSWLDGWAVARLPGASGFEDRRTIARALLDRTLLTTRGHEFRAAEAWNLMVLRGWEAAALGRTPGCLRFEYVENEYSYRRFDCYAYRPAPDSSGAEPWFELRLVYRVASSSSQPLRDLDDAAAEELYLLFPAPAGTAVEEHQIRVLEELSQAVGRALPALRLTNERGSSTHGFNLSDGRSRLRVKANHIAWFGGRRAVQVRVTWVD